MSFKSILGGAGHVIAAPVAGLEGLLRPPVDPNIANSTAMAAAAPTIQTPDIPALQLPVPDATLNDEGMHAKAKWESDPATKDQPFVPQPDQYKDPAYPQIKENYDTIMAANSAYDAAHPNRDFKQEYLNALKEHATQPSGRSMNPLAAFAIAMGAGPGERDKLLGDLNATNETANATDLKNWQDLVDLRHQAVQGAIAQSLEKGQYHQILSKGYIDYLQNIRAEQAKNKERMAEIGARGTSAADVARIRGEWGFRAAAQRTQAIMQAHDIKAGSDQAKILQAAYTSAYSQARKAGKDGMDAADDATSMVEELVANIHKAGSIANPPATPAAATSTLSPMAKKIAEQRAAKK